ncbi:MAG: hypothetical protein AAF991_06630, partial [Pseudomonadota bacterium]
HPDIFITRVERSDRQQACEGDGDLLLLGPDYRQAQQVKSVASGRSAWVYAANDHLLRLSGGERWEGDVEVIRFVETTVSTK